MSTHQVAAVDFTEDDMALLRQMFARVTETSCRLGTHSFVNSTLDIEDLIRSYHGKNGSGQNTSLWERNIFLSIVFESGVQARKDMVDQPEYNIVLEEFRSNWSEDQRKKIPLGSEGMTDLLNIQLLSDMICDFDISHLSSGPKTSEGLIDASAIPVPILKQLSKKTLYMAQWILTTSAAYAVSYAKPSALPWQPFPREVQELQKRIHDSTTFREYCFDSLKDYKTICRTRWSDMSSDQQIAKQVLKEVQENRQAEQRAKDDMASARLHYAKNPSTSSRIGTHTLIERTIDVSKLKERYGGLTPREKDVVLTLLFESGTEARATLVDDPEYKIALNDVRSEWSDDQRKNIPLHSRDMADLLTLQLLVDILDTFDTKHLGPGEAYGDNSAVAKFPVSIKDLFFSDQARYIAEEVLHLKVALDTVAEERMNACAEGAHDIGTTHSDRPCQTLWKWCTSRLQDLDTIRSEKYGEVPSDWRSFEDLISETARQRLFGDTTKKTNTTSTPEQHSSSKGNKNQQQKKKKPKKK